MKEKYLINARIIDPKNQLDEIGGVIVNEKGHIKAVGKMVGNGNIPDQVEKIDLKNMVLIPSVNAVIPFFLSKPNSVICLPSVFRVRLAAGKILILDLSLPLRFKKSTIETLSITGDVLGIDTTDVTPPATAASLNVLKFSLYS